MKRIVVLLLLSAGAWSDAAPAPGPIRFSLHTAALDLTNCLARPGDARVPLNASNVNVEIVNWQTAAVTNGQPGEFVLRFRRPTPVGTLIAYEPGAVSYSLNGQWQALPPVEAGARALQVLPLPPDALVDALRFVAPARLAADPAAGEKLFRATLPFVTVLPVRFINIAPDARATASSTNVSGPKPSPVSAIVDGVVDASRNFSTAKRATSISSNAPEWIQLTWPAPQTFRGLGFFFGAEEKGLGDVVIETYHGAGDPLSGTGTNDWVEVKGRATRPGDFRGNQIFVAHENLDTRALRVKCIGGTDQMGLGELAVYSFLGSDVMPARKTPPSP